MSRTTKRVSLETHQHVIVQKPRLSVSSSELLTGRFYNGDCSSLQRGTNTVASVATGTPAPLIFLARFSRKGIRTPRTLFLQRRQLHGHKSAHAARSSGRVAPTGCVRGGLHSRRPSLGRLTLTSRFRWRPAPPVPSVVTTPAPRADQSFLRPSRALPAFSRLRGPLRQPHSSSGPEPRCMVSQTMKKGALFLTCHPF